eukprot:Nk52_evm12s32 gene=Nk52_evmTU12s32
MGKTQEAGGGGLDSSTMQAPSSSTAARVFGIPVSECVANDVQSISHVINSKSGYNNNKKNNKKKSTTASSSTEGADALIQLIQQFRFNNVPLIISKCIDYLERDDDVYSEGLYRLSGALSRIRSIREKADGGDLAGYLSEMDNEGDCNVIAALLKLYIRELPSPLIGSSLAKQLEEQFAILVDDNHKHDQEDYERGKDPEGDKVLEEVERLLYKGLGPCEYATCFRLFSHLHLVSLHCDNNKMTAENIAIVFSPTIHLSKECLIELIKTPTMLLFSRIEPEEVFGREEEEEEEEEEELGGKEEEGQGGREDKGRTKGDKGYGPPRRVSVSMEKERSAEGLLEEEGRGGEIAVQSVQSRLPVGSGLSLTGSSSSSISISNNSSGSSLSVSPASKVKEEEVERDPEANAEERCRLLRLYVEMVYMKENLVALRNRLSAGIGAEKKEVERIQKYGSKYQAKADILQQQDGRAVVTGWLRHGIAGEGLGSPAGNARGSYHAAAVIGGRGPGGVGYDSDDTSCSETSASISATSASLSTSNNDLNTATSLSSVDNIPENGFPTPHNHPQRPGTATPIKLIQLPGTPSRQNSPRGNGQPSFARDSNGHTKPPSDDEDEDERENLYATIVRLEEANTGLKEDNDLYQGQVLDELVHIAHLQASARVVKDLAQLMSSNTPILSFEKN